MGGHTFGQWLCGETAAARCALLALYEQRDRLLYIEGPRLEKSYMDQFGADEAPVIREEMECELLREKQRLVQAALNRREPIDEAAIDAALEQRRQQLLREAAGAAAPQEVAELSEQQSEELQALYHDIVRDFYPQMHPGQTETHRQLFQKAQEAYRRRDLAALQLIHAMLRSTQEDERALEQLLGLLKDMTHREEGPAPGGSIADYSLAAVIYGAFRPTSEEMTLREEQKRCRQLTDSVMKEMDELRQQFPYTAADMLSDPAKTAAYREELAHRLYAALAEQQRRTEEIRAMIESVTGHA